MIRKIAFLLLSMPTIVLSVDLQQMRHDELLKTTIELGRELADPANVSLIEWAGCFMPTTTVIGCCTADIIWDQSKISLPIQVPLYVLTVTGITAVTTSLLAGTAVTYKKWRIEKTADKLKKLIVQTNLEQILTLSIVHVLVQNYQTELSLHTKNTATEYCNAILQDISDTIQNHMTELGALHQ